MKKYLIYQHLGLGDHILCNGLIREICKKDGYFFLLCKHHNYHSVNFMFRDLENLKVLSLGNQPEDLNMIINYSKDKDLELIKIGHENLNNEMRFDMSFYNQFNVNFEKRWSSFFIKRDYEKEMNLFRKINSNSQEYIFIHEDNERGLNIIANNYNNQKIIKADRQFTDNIIDYLTVLENAKEIHCIESSFLFLIDSFNFKGKLYNHRYARSYPQNNTPTLKNKWEILIN